MKMKKTYIKESRSNTEFETRIGKVVKEFSKEHATISIAEIKSWVEVDDMKKAERRRRITSVAASFILICGIGLSYGYYVNMDEPIAMAGKDDVNISVEEGAGVNEYVRTDWDEAMKLAAEYPDMLVPGYMPEGYEFKALKIIRTNVGNTYEFRFEDIRSNRLSLRQKIGGETAAITDYDTEIQGSEGPVYLKQEGEFVLASCVRGKMVVIIKGKDSEKEIIQMIDTLKSGSQSLHL